MAKTFKPTHEEMGKGPKKYTELPPTLGAAADNL
jgi:hypothetical protein